MPVSQEELMEALEQMTPEQRLKSKECAEKLLSLIQEYGDCGLMALGIVGATIENMIDQGEMS